MRAKEFIPEIQSEPKFYPMPLKLGQYRDAEDPRTGDAYPDEYLDNYAKSILKNEEERHRLIEKKSESMVLEFIKANADLNVKSVSQKAFDDLFEK